MTAIHRIFIDTNALHQSWPNVSARTENVLTAARKLGIAVEIPLPVVMELERRWSERLTDVRTKFASTASDLTRLLASVGEPDVTSSLPDWDHLHEAYPRYVKTVFQKWSVEVTPMPSVALGEVFRHAVHQELAFEKEGRNFKDVVIFLAVVERMRQLGSENAVLISDDGIFAKRKEELFGYASKMGVRLHFWTLEEVEPKLRNMLEEAPKARFLRHQQLATKAFLATLPEIQRLFNEGRNYHNAIMRNSRIYLAKTLESVQFNDVADVDIAVLDREPEVGDEVRMSAYLRGVGLYTRSDPNIGGVT